MTQFVYHGVVFDAPMQMSDSGPGLVRELELGEGTTVITIECLETWREFTRMEPEVWVEDCADDPEFVASAIESAEYDQNMEVDRW